MALSDEYDDQAINGDGQSPNVNGLINQLTNPADPTNVADFDAFVAAFADQIEGLWASRIREVSIVANVDAYKLAAKKFHDRPSTPGTGAASAWATPRSRTTPRRRPAGSGPTSGCPPPPRTSRGASSTAWAGRGCGPRVTRPGAPSRFDDIYYKVVDPLRLTPREPPYSLT